MVLCSSALTTVRINLVNVFMSRYLCLFANQPTCPPSPPFYGPPANLSTRPSTHAPTCSPSHAHIVHRSTVQSQTSNLFTSPPFICKLMLHQPRGAHASSPCHSREVLTRHRHVTAQRNDNRFCFRQRSTVTDVEWASGWIGGREGWQAGGQAGGRTDWRVGKQVGWWTGGWAGIWASERVGG